MYIFSMAFILQLVHQTMGVCRRNQPRPRHDDDDTNGNNNNNNDNNNNNNNNDNNNNNSAPCCIHCKCSGAAQADIVDTTTTTTTTADDSTNDDADGNPNTTEATSAAVANDSDYDDMPPLIDADDADQQQQQQEKPAAAEPTFVTNNNNSNNNNTADTTSLAELEHLFELNLERPQQEIVRIREMHRKMSSTAAATAPESADTENDSSNTETTKALGSVAGLQKEALLIGINYIGQPSALAGCINDAQNMKLYLSHPANGVAIQTALMMTDRTSLQPTRQNMEAAIRYMVRRTCQQGGTLFFHNSGHGSQIPGGTEEDRRDECLVPLDYARSGMILDNWLFQQIANEMAATEKPVRCICIMDTCHSGSMLDLANSYDYTGGSIPQLQHRPVRDPRTTVHGNIIAISGCRDAQTSSDANQNGVAFGALTNALLATLGAAPDKRQLTWRQLMVGTNQRLARGGFSQVSQLSSEQPLDLDAAIDW